MERLDKARETTNRGGAGGGGDPDRAEKIMIPSDSGDPGRDTVTEAELVGLKTKADL